MTCTYRGHGAMIAMGSPLDACFAEIVGRPLGLCGGKGGSMHLADFERGALGSFAVVGAGLPVAVGAALAAQVRGDHGVALSFFGDGATNIGAFHESLNLAAIWKLPCVFVCENNLYGEYSPIANTTPIGGHRRPGEQLRHARGDGRRQRSGRGQRDRRRRGRSGPGSGGGPTLVEAKTYRHVGPLASDPGAYRPEGELDAWRERDPLGITEQQLLGLGVAATVIEQITSDARADVTAARERALASPPPALESRFTDILA